MVEQKRPKMVILDGRLIKRKEVFMLSTDSNTCIPSSVKH